MEAIVLLSSSPVFFLLSTPTQWLDHSRLLIGREWQKWRWWFLRKEWLIGSLTSVLRHFGVRPISNKKGLQHTHCCYTLLKSKFLRQVFYLFPANRRRKWISIDIEILPSVPIELREEKQGEATTFIQVSSQLNCGSSFIPFGSNCNVYCDQTLSFQIYLLPFSIKIKQNILNKYHHVVESMEQNKKVLLGYCSSHWRNSPMSWTSSISKH